MCYILYIDYTLKTIQYIVFNTIIYNIQFCMYVLNTSICYIQELMKKFQSILEISKAGYQFEVWISKKPDTNFMFRNQKNYIIKNT